MDLSRVNADLLLRLAQGGVDQVAIALLKAAARQADLPAVDTRIGRAQDERKIDGTGIGIEKDKHAALASIGMGRIIQLGAWTRLGGHIVLGAAPRQRLLQIMLKGVDKALK